MQLEHEKKRRLVLEERLKLLESLTDGVIGFCGRTADSLSQVEEDYL